MYGTFESVTWLGIIASIICVIPMFFYDLSEKKHANYIRALRIRAVVENYKNDELSPEDVESLREIVNFANQEQDQFVLDELQQHTEVALILEKESA